MIDRNILKVVELSIKTKPVTLITGARQVGKSTLALLFEKKGFNYVSLDNSRERELANKDPKMFLSIHPWPLIIDEVQKAPELFETIEEIVNEEKRINEKNYGMFILTGSQMYKLMNGVTESLSGRVSIVHMMPLSRNEILNREEPIFNFDILKINERAKNNPLNPIDLYNLIVKGFYPELYSNELLTAQKCYADYVETYIERDVSDLINVRDKFLFRRFMELLASLTGEELVYDNIANIIGIDKKTVMAWLSVLIAGDIVYLLEPYNEISISKRIVKRPKLYFSDTGLACYLIEPNFYYYRDNNMKEIYLIIINDGKLNRIECKSGFKFNNSAVKGFKQLDKTSYNIGAKVIICNTDVVYPLEDGVYVLPLAGI